MNIKKPEKTDTKIKEVSFDNLLKALTSVPPKNIEAKKKTKQTKKKK